METWAVGTCDCRGCVLTRKLKNTSIMIDIGKWYDYDELQLQWQWPLVSSLHSYSNEASGRIANDSRTIRELVKDNRWRI